MRRLTGAVAVAALAASAPTSPAMAVGLGPLAKQGVTDGAAKAFYLTLYNPYAERADFPSTRSAPKTRRRPPASGCRPDRCR